MKITPDQMVSISEANQNFSKLTRLVDEKKEMVIMKNNKPKYIMVDYETYLQKTGDK